MSHRELPPTFPIPKHKILWEKLKTISTSPVTWAAGATSATSGILLNPAAAITTTAASFIGAAAWWKGKLPEVEERAIRRLILESNEYQNDTLSRGISQLQKWKCRDYADKLSEFLHLKKKSEYIIHAREPRTPIDENVETLIDTLCNEVSRDLFKMADIRYTRRKKRKRLNKSSNQELINNQVELGKRVDEALKALRDTHAQLQASFDRTLPDEGDNELLDQTIQKLREEADLAARIRHRIESTHGHHIESLNRTETTYSSSTSVSE